MKLDCKTRIQPEMKPVPLTLGYLILSAKSGEREREIWLQFVLQSFAEILL